MKSLIATLVALSVLTAPSFCLGQSMLTSCPQDRVDWATLPSKYTHDRSNGMRVDQYAKPVDPVAPARDDFRRSGYRQSRSSIQVGSSADNYHVVEQWGAPVQPYDEWRFPFRPYSVPYNQWGPPTQFWGNGFGAPFPYGGVYQPGFIPGVGVPGVGVPGVGMPGNPNVNPPAPNMPPGNFPNGYPYPGYNPNVSPWNPYGNGPWQDGYYQDAPRTPRLPDNQFFNKPAQP